MKKDPHRKKLNQTQTTQKEKGQVFDIKLFTVLLIISSITVISI